MAHDVYEYVDVAVLNDSSMFLFFNESFYCIKMFAGEYEMSSIKQNFILHTFDVFCVFLI